MDEAPASVVDGLADGVIAIHQLANLAGFSHRPRALILALAGAARTRDNSQVELFDEELADLQNCSPKRVQRQREDYFAEARARNLHLVEIVEGEYDHGKGKNVATRYRFHLAGHVEKVVSLARASSHWHASDRRKQCAEEVQAQNRGLPFGREARELLAALCARDGGLLFTDERGRVLTLANVSNLFRRRAARTGLKGLKFHSLRHTFGSRLAEPLRDCAPDGPLRYQDLDDLRPRVRRAAPRGPRMRLHLESRTAGGHKDFRGGLRPRLQRLKRKGVGRNVKALRVNCIVIFPPRCYHLLRQPIQQKP